MAKPKKVKIDLIDPEQCPEPYSMLQKVRDAWHADTENASIGLAWKLDTKCDADGRLTLGMCCRASEMQRAVADYDFIILLNKEVWDDEEFTDDKKLALLDHELMHAARSVDDEGEQRWDSKGRRLWRIRRHDIEEFTSVVRRHGVYNNLQAFAEALKAKRAKPLFAVSVDSVDGSGDSIQ
jgi:Putative phage metallopeptidase